MKFLTHSKQIKMAGYLAMLVLLHVNAILKTEDPIADTQTEGILYDQKMEQEKDGVKAPATPKMIYYGGQGFLGKGSLAKYDKEMTSRVAGKKKEKFSWSDWWDDKSSDAHVDGAQGTESGQTLLEEAPGILEGESDVLPTKPNTVPDEQAVPRQATPKQESQPTQLSSEDVALTDEAIPEVEEAPVAGDDWW